MPLQWQSSRGMILWDVMGMLFCLISGVLSLIFLMQTLNTGIYRVIQFDYRVWAADSQCLSFRLGSNVPTNFRSEQILAEFQVVFIPVSDQFLMCVVPAVR